MTVKFSGHRCEGMEISHVLEQFNPQNQEIHQLKPRNARNGCPKLGQIPLAPLPFEALVFILFVLCDARQGRHVLKAS